MSHAAASVVAAVVAVVVAVVVAAVVAADSAHSVCGVCLLSVVSSGCHRGRKRHTVHISTVSVPTHLAEAVVAAAAAAAAAAASAGDFCQPSVKSSGCHGDTRYHTVHISNYTSSAAASVSVSASAVVAVVAVVVAVVAAAVVAAVYAVCLDSVPVVDMDHLALDGQET